MGQLLVFHSNFVHYGGYSSAESLLQITAENFQTSAESPLQITAENLQNNINIEWFTGKKKGLKVTDISLHAGLENKLFEKRISSDYETGRADFINVLFVDNPKTDNKNRKKFYEACQDVDNIIECRKRDPKEIRDGLKNIDSEEVRGREVFHSLVEATDALRRMKNNQPAIGN